MHYIHTDCLEYGEDERNKKFSYKEQTDECFYSLNSSKWNLKSEISLLKTKNSFLRVAEFSLFRAKFHKEFQEFEINSFTGYFTCVSRVTNCLNYFEADHMIFRIYACKIMLIDNPLMLPDDY